MSNGESSPLLKEEEIEAWAKEGLNAHNKMVQKIMDEMTDLLIARLKEGNEDIADNPDKLIEVFDKTTKHRYQFTLNGVGYKCDYPNAFFWQFIRANYVRDEVILKLKLDGGLSHAKKIKKSSDYF